MKRWVTGSGKELGRAAQGSYEPGTLTYDWHLHDRRLWGHWVQVAWVWWDFLPSWCWGRTILAVRWEIGSRNRSRETIEDCLSNPSEGKGGILCTKNPRHRLLWKAQSTSRACPGTSWRHLYYRTVLPNTRLSIVLRGRVGHPEEPFCRLKSRLRV